MRTTDQGETAMNDQVEPQPIGCQAASCALSATLVTIRARYRTSTEVSAEEDTHGRWMNEYAYNGKTWVRIEQQGRPSKWVTLRASRFLRAALE